MSGGVDSSVCAALLKDRGLEVVGVTMQIWPGGSIDGDGCCGLEAIEQARKVAFELGIPHYVLNLRDIFKQRVIANFCEEYKQARTPNPCIRCNQYIKFDALLGKARQLNADCIATGHYARIVFDREQKKYILKKGIDRQKEQSYVLYVLTQRQLAHILMPLGEFTKGQVRRIAQEKGLPVADRPESQEICFIPDNNYRGFLKEHIDTEISPGHIVNKQGQIVGEHYGIIFYTIGQRKGIGIAAKEPLYVTSIDKENNTIAVGEKEDVYGDELLANELNLINIDRLDTALSLKVKVRYLHRPAQATIFAQAEDRIRVRFSQPQWAITPGQAAVFYDGDIVVGGATIVSSKNCA